MHCIVMYGEAASDTELPGVEFDLEHFSFSVLWKPMLSMFYGEAEYQKWTAKVIQQHHKRNNTGWMSMMSEAFRQGDQDRFQELFRVAWDSKHEEEDRRKKVIRTTRFTRLLERVDYQEKGEDLTELIEMAGRARFVQSIRRSLAWARDKKEKSGMGVEQRAERGFGCFYDSMGMKFDGKGELNNPGEMADELTTMTTTKRMTTSTTSVTRTLR